MTLGLKSIFGGAPNKITKCKNIFGNPIFLIMSLSIILIILFFFIFVIQMNNFKYFALSVIFIFFAVPIFVMGYEFFRKKSLEERFGNKNTYEYSRPSDVFQSNIGYKERPRPEDIYYGGNNQIQGNNTLAEVDNLSTWIGGDYGESEKDSIIENWMEMGT